MWIGYDVTISFQDQIDIIYGLEQKREDDVVT
jgi:hypothetical protein